MNILILSWRGLGHPTSGGAELSTWQHARGWVKAGHQVTILTAAFVNCKRDEIVEGITLMRRGDQFIGVRLAAFFWYWFGKHSQIDLVVDEFHGIPFFTPVWALKSKKLGFIHEVAQPVWALNPWSWPLNLIPATIGKYGEPLMFKLFYRGVPFMTVSQSTKKDLEAFGIRRIVVVHNGVSLPDKLPRLAKEKDFTIIYLSSIAMDKGINDALQTFNLLKKIIPKSKFWVVGKGNPEFVLALQKFSPQTKFWGFVSEKLKFELLAKAHVLLFPSVHEGWGLVIMEAASVGTPTVAYNVSGVRDAVKDGETGLLAKYNQPQNLAKLLQQLYLNQGQYIKLSANCKKYSQRFTWSNSQLKSTKLIEML